jgi:hypothetical protein
MNRIIVVAASVVLLAGIGDAGAKTSKKNGYQGHRGNFVQRNVSLPERNVGASYGMPANANFRYGPQPYYPQSPIGGAP